MGLTLQPVLSWTQSGGAAPAPAIITKTAFVSAGSSVWTVDPNFISLTRALLVGPGGNGAQGRGDTAPAPTGQTGAGGGGAAFAKATSLTFTHISPGDVLPLRLPAGGAEQTAYLKDNTGAIVLQADFGRNASGVTKGTKGLASASIGEVVRDGSDGGNGLVTTGSRGGAGGGGPGTEAAAGVDAASSPATSTGSAGGANGDGLAGGNPGGPGVAGSPGATGTTWDGARGPGSGGGGGGSTAVGGAGGSLGGGGGGGGKNSSSPTPAGGVGGPAGLFIEYLAYDIPSPDLGLGVFVPAGQSNMVGRATITGSEVADPDVFQFPNFVPPGFDANYGYPTGWDASTYHIWVSQEYPLLNQEGASILDAGGAGYVSPANQFSKDYSDAIGRKIGVVPNGWGSSRVTAGWRVTPSVGANLATTISSTNAAITAAKALNVNANIVAIAWMLGETDAVNALSGASYQTGALAALDYMRANITGASDETPIFIGSMVEDAIKSAAHAGMTFHEVDAAQMQIVFLRPNVTFTRGPSAQDLNDHLHGNLTWLNTVGARMAASRSRLAKPEITYDFDDEIVSSTHIQGMADISVGTVATLLATAAKTGMNGTYLTSAGTFGTSDYFGKLIECYPTTQAAQVVEWRESYNNGGKSGVTLMAQPGTACLATKNYGPYGLQFEIDNSGTGSVRAWLPASGSRAAATGAVALAKSKGRWWRASVLAGIAKLEYSDDDRATWTTLLAPFAYTTYTTGQAAYGQWDGTTSGDVFVDKITCRAAI